MTSDEPDTVVFTGAVAEIAGLNGDNLSIHSRLIELNLEETKLLMLMDIDVKNIISKKEGDVRSIDAGEATLEDGRRMIADTIAEDERMMAKYREVIAIEDEAIALNKRVIGNYERMSFLYGVIIDFYTRSIPIRKAELVEYPAKLKEEKARRRELRSKLKKAKRSGDT